MRFVFRTHFHLTVFFNTSLIGIISLKLCFKQGCIHRMPKLEATQVIKLLFVMLEIDSRYLLSESLNVIFLHRGK